MHLPSIKFLAATIFTAFCSSFQWGYHCCNINVPQHVFKEMINETSVIRYGKYISPDALTLLFSWTVSVYSVGGLIGAALTPICAEKLGRKSSLMVWSNVLTIVASLMMSYWNTAHSLELLLAGRFIIGIVSGLTTCLLPVYLSECSPTQYRGLMGTLQNFLINVVTVLSFFISSPELLGRAEYIPFLLGLGLLTAVPQLIMSFFLEESPKYLYIKRKDPKAAEKSLRFWSGSSDPASVDIKKSFEEFEVEAETLKQEVSVFGALKIPYFRKIMIVAIVLMICQAASGAPALYGYSTQMFMEVGLTLPVAQLCTEMLSVASTVAALLSTPIIVKVTRRGLFFSSNILLVLSLLTYAVGGIIYGKFGLPWTSYIAAGSIFLFGIVYNSGTGPLSYIIPPEMSPQALRSTVNGVGWTVSWTLALLVTLIYPPVDGKMGPASFFIFLVPLMAGMVYLYKVMPETSKESVGEIVRKNSAPLGQVVAIGEKGDGAQHGHMNIVRDQLTV